MKTEAAYSFTKKARLKRALRNRRRKRRGKGSKHVLDIKS